MVGVAGFEPATPASRTQCSTRLSHTPTMKSAPYSEAIPGPQAIKRRKGDGKRARARCPCGQKNRAQAVAWLRSLGYSLRLPVKPRPAGPDGSHSWGMV